MTFTAKDREKLISEFNTIATHVGENSSFWNFLTPALLSWLVWAMDAGVETDLLFKYRQAQEAEKLASKMLEKRSADDSERIVKLVDTNRRLEVEFRGAKEQAEKYSRAIEALALQVAKLEKRNQALEQQVSQDNASLTRLKAALYDYEHKEE